MKYKVKFIIMKIQEYMTYITHSKAFIYALIAIILGFVVVGFSVKTKTEVKENFYFNDTLELREAQRQITEDIDMSEINRIAKLLSFFFNDVIINKTAIVNGISENFEDIYNYDMQITKVTKAGNTYEASIVIAKPITNSDELIFEPYKRYQVVITNTQSGMKVDYINIIE
ncbi:MAG: hypothetical protein MJ245_02755 [Clostridia bacterium]|nr:hypothetical protein [Clostridia bacterium]